MEPDDFYDRYKKESRLFPIVLKIGTNDEIPVDFVTLTKRSPHLAKLTTELLEENEFHRITIPIDPSMCVRDTEKSSETISIYLKQVIESWYVSVPSLTNEIYESTLTLLLADWLEDEKTKQTCIKALRRRTNCMTTNEIAKLFSIARCHNCQDLADHCLRRLWQDSEFEKSKLLILLNEHKCFGQYQLEFVESYSSREPILECIRSLKSPLIPSQNDSMRAALTTLFLGNSSPQRKEVASNILLAFRILTNDLRGHLKDSLESAHPDIVRLLRESLSEALNYPMTASSGQTNDDTN